MLLLETFPDVVVDYCRTYFKSRFSLWKVLLQEILSRISCCEDEPSPSICSVYRGEFSSPSLQFPSCLPILLRLSLSFSFSLSVFVCFFVSLLFPSLFPPLSVFPSVALSLFLCLPVCLSVSLFVCLSVSLFLSLPYSLSFSLSALPYASICCHTIV